MFHQIKAKHCWDRGQFRSNVAVAGYNWWLHLLFRRCQINISRAYLQEVAAIYLAHQLLSELHSQG